MNLPTTVLRVELIAVLLETLFFGCFCLLYPISLWMLVYRHRHRGRGYAKLGIGLFSMVTAMFILAMTHLILTAQNVIVAFADHSTSPGGPFLFLVSGREDSRLSATIVIVAVVAFIGDSFMIYRVFIMWGQSWASIILPSAFCIGTIVSTGVCAYDYKNTRLDIAEALHADGVFTLMTTYLGFVLATNMSTLALIIGRLMRHDRMVRRYRVDIPGPSIHWRVARTIIQSEAMYSATVIATLVLYIARSKAFLITSNMLPPLVGISFTLIITHVGFDEIMGRLRDVEQSPDLEWVVNHPAKHSSKSGSIAPSISSAANAVKRETSSTFGEPAEVSTPVLIGGMSGSGGAVFARP